MEREIPIINLLVKEKRKKLKITQEAFTKIINKSIATVRRYDTGDIIPENTLILICDKLNLSIYELAIEQKKENLEKGIDNYSEFVKKYDKSKLFDILDFSKENPFEEYHKERIETIASKLSILYSILYNDFYDNLTQDVIKHQRFDLKSKEYITSSEFENDKIIIKEVLKFENESVEERIVDIFKISNVEKMFESLQEFFNIKLIAMRKLKLRQDKFEKPWPQKNNLKNFH